MFRSIFLVALYWLAMLAAVLGVTFLAARGSQAAISDCIDATCRITASDGSRGTGCVFEMSDRLVYVLTAAHVVGSDATVQCEFWRQGHQSRPLAGRVATRSEAADAAVVALTKDVFGGLLPAVVPLAPREHVVRPGETLLSVGCAGGAWSTGWKGHALGYEGQDLRFVPSPANGRSGSAVFDAEGRQIVALVRARTGGNDEGIATPVQAIYRAFDVAAGAGKLPGARAGGTPALQLAQCGPNGCPARPEPWPNHLLPYRYRHEQGQPQQGPAPQNQTPWPSLPPAETSPARPPLDIAPVDEKLGRIAAMLEDLKKGREAGAVPTPQNAGGTPAPQTTGGTAAPQPAVDEHARRAAETALGLVADLRAEAEKNVREVKTEAAKANEAVGGLTVVVEKIKDSISENGTLSQRFHARMDRVKADLEERLGREATDREVRIGYVKDLVQEKISDGGLVGLAKALGLPTGLVVVVWLVTRDVKHKRETGDPLVVEKLAALVEGRFGVLQQRLESLKDRLHGAVTSASEPPKSSPG